MRFSQGGTVKELSKSELLLEDYKATLEMLKHEDSRRDSIFKTFLFVNAGYFAIIAFLAGRANFGARVWQVIIASALLILLNVAFIFVLERLRVFARYRNFHMRYLERELGVISQQTRELELRDNGQLHNPAGSEDSLRIHFWASLPASKMESLAPSFACVILLGFILYLASGGAI
jgi:hypothetical protein